MLSGKEIKEVMEEVKRTFVLNCGHCIFSEGECRFRCGKILNEYESIERLSRGDEIFFMNVLADKKCEKCKFDKECDRRIEHDMDNLCYELLVYFDMAI